MNQDDLRNIQQSKSLPSTESMDMMAYGSSYVRVKKYLWELEHEIDIVRTRKTEILSRLDLEIANKIENEDPHAFYTERPLENLDQETADTIMDVRDYLRYQLTELWLQDRIVRIQLAGRSIGNAEHSIRLKRLGYSEDDWNTASRAAASQTPLRYDSTKVI
ncbi:MAG: hypothetical protein WCR24_06960 [Candidatus Methanomethylophilaceae archaeon]